jgi:hypothetical protein
MTSCDTDIDWGSSKEEIVDDKDDDEGLLKSYDVDLSLEIDSKEVNCDDHQKPSSGLG